MITLPIVISKHISWQNVGSNVYIFDEVDNQVTKLCDISTMFWNQLLIASSFNEIILSVQEEYEVDYDVVEGDLHEFIGNLVRKKIID